MTYDEFDERFESDNDMYDQYMEYIMENCHGERHIGNGDALIVAAEDFFLYEDFRDYWLENNG